MTDSSVVERVRSLREWIESDGYDEAAPLTLRKDDFAQMMTYLLSLEKTQRFLIEALDRLALEPDTEALLEKARESETTSAEISASLIRRVRELEAARAG